eukprot:CAMPEP_0185599156 /NCGR_PEP_ID=MMETSP0434-20130131/82498_1 /TAXON_ID=626734 ORGANISM="Favella taraikaensis, Strain Fe Narragansett Bay" /NCGR_SAMPLE_ID=MMETSP0434 /ASSEMBLY_ACC=CAM_ASM_000379 /LENGTH=68 /DNA_ID=CAMNT_0028228431 /DNA_START=1952 /DNA_END=2158 /DNA_ORIENTATION=-
MDSYALNWRQGRRTGQQQLLPAGDSDCGEDDDDSVEGYLDVDYDCAVKGGGSSSIKIVRTAKDKALSQ